MKQATQWDFLPKEIQNEFLMGGNVDLLHWYFSEGDSAIKPDLYTEDVVNQYLNRIKYRCQGQSYGMTDSWLYNALDKHDIKDMSVAIMGSIMPWYESMCINYGGKPTAIEYNVIEPTDKRLKMIHINDCKNHPQFDAALSISSFEHDGLGRYGDPINPDGDFRAMKEMKRLLKKDGLLFLAVPVGKDKLVWNAHRIYGEIRLPYLIDGWELIDQEGFDEGLMEVDTKESGVYQPILVLKNI